MITPPRTFSRSTIRSKSPVPTTFQVVNFTQTPSGFDVQFNRDVNFGAGSTINLYNPETVEGLPPEPADLTVTNSSGQLVKGSLVTASLFPLLGVRPALGRFFSEDEDRADSHAEPAGRR